MSEDVVIEIHNAVRKLSKNQHPFWKLRVGTDFLTAWESEWQRGFEVGERVRGIVTTDGKFKTFHPPKVSSGEKGAEGLKASIPAKAKVASGGSEAVQILRGILDKVTEIAERMPVSSPGALIPLDEEEWKPDEENA